MAVDSQWGSVVLLMPLSSDLLDVKAHAITVNGNSALSSTVGTPFGAGNCCHFDGAGDWLATPTSSDWAFGTGDFTCEAWVYCASLPGGGSNNDMLVLGQVVATPYPFFYLDNATGKMSLFDGASGVTGSTGITLSAWNHLEWSRSAGTLKLFLNGVSIASQSFGTNFSSNSSFGVGGGSGGNRYFNGYISNARVTKGAARHTANFSVPTAPFPRPTITGTVYDSAGAKASKVVVAQKRSTLAVAGQAVSNGSTGIYTIYPADFSEHVVTEFDTATYPLVDGGSGENAIIYDRVIPG